LEAAGEQEIQYGKLHASERRSVEQALEQLEQIERRRLPVLLARLRRRMEIPDGARVLELGAAQGTYLIALTRLGFQAQGIEPWGEAIETSRELSRAAGVETNIVQGQGEDLSAFESDSFDLVLAISVMEHVDDVDAVFREVLRVLKPGGGFYFYTGSALHPRQVEIQGFPLFPWYPSKLKRRIMDWAVEKRPHLVGYTEKPAYNWFTPWGTRKALLRAGYSRAIERWEMVDPEELSGRKRIGTIAMQRVPGARLAGAFASGAIAFLAIK
jgi:SAM-dependent methyltransferase